METDGMPTKRLTAREETYCQMRAAGKSLLDAHRAAYPGQKCSDATARRAAHRRDQKPAIATRIAELSSRIHERMTERAVEQVVVTRQWVREQLIENVLTAKTPQPILSRKGEVVGHTVDLGAANRALELLGKDIGMFKASEDEKSHPLDALDEEQVRALAAAVDEELGRRAAEEKEAGKKPH